MRAEVDLFTELADRVENSRRITELVDRERQMINDANTQVVRLGQEAVEHGMDRPGLVAKVWATVARQRELMRAAGGVLIGPEVPAQRERSFFVRSKAIPIAGDMAISLSQRSGFPRQASQFWRIYDDLGVEGALDACAMPGTTIATLLDTRTRQSVYSVRLAPRESRFHDMTFRDEWQHDMFPFSAPEFDAPIDADRTVGGRHTVETMSEGQLVVGAGYDARFNLFLDEAAAALKV